MLPFRRLGVALGSLFLAILLDHSASADCKKSLTLREVPGGEPQPAQLIECDESEPPALLAPSSHLSLCDPKALAQAGVAFEDCARAVDAAREGLRKAKVRAALRKGDDEASIAQRYGASEAELDALSATADLSGPMPASSESSEEVAR